MVGGPSRLGLIRKAAALATMFPHFDLSCAEYAVRRYCNTESEERIPRRRKKKLEPASAAVQDLWDKVLKVDVPLARHTVHRAAVRLFIFGFAFWFVNTML